ncbi:MAG: methyltransferase [Bacteroidales bacterium]|nr:methyltransferase [Bacteroidales bacterium]
MNQAFRFKQFQVNDNLSTMKVGTDAVLLGAWATPPTEGRILDIGTGCGVIALMMAQKSNAHITAIDIHEPSVQQAQDNFGLSPWSERLNAINISLEDFTSTHKNCFDFIVSNPPYFINSLKPCKDGLLLAKHADDRFMDVFISSIATLLKNTGKAAFIIPPNLLEAMLRKSVDKGLFMVRKANIFSKPGTAQTRVVLEFAMQQTGSAEEETIFIRNANHSYTEAYKALTNDFYLFLNE